MIDLYMFATPNCWKVSIMLEEMGLPYAVKWVKIREGEQNSPEYRAICPMGKVPVLVENGAAKTTVYGSPGILLYLADRADKLMPKSGKARAEVEEWLGFALTDLGMAINGRARFRNLQDAQYQSAIEVFEKDIDRCMKRMDERLGQSDYLAGAYSVADIAAIPFVGGPRREPERLAKFPNVRRWAEALEARPQVKKGLRTEP